MLSGFERLPPYLRDQIFEYVLVMDTGNYTLDDYENPILEWGQIRRRENDSQDEKIELGAMFLNKWLHAEAVDFFLKANTSFTFTNMRYLKAFMANLARFRDETSRPVLEQIRLRIDTVLGYDEGAASLLEVLGDLDGKKFPSGLSDRVPALRRLCVDFEVVDFKYNGCRAEMRADVRSSDMGKFNTIVKALEERVRVPEVEVFGLESEELTARMEARMKEPVEKAAYDRCLEVVEEDESEASSLPA